MGAARAKETTTDRAISSSLDADKRFFVGFTVATFLGVLLAIATMQAVNPSGSSSSALAPYIAREFCSKYGVAPATTPDNDSHLVNINAAPHADRLDSMERKLEELALTIKTLADSSVVIASKLDSELASAARTLEDLGERLHRVENHVFVSEDLA